MLKNMKIHFITLYVPNSKFKLHGAHNFCCTYELQYTQFFSRQRLFYELQTVYYEAANLINERPIGLHPANPEDGA